MREDLLAGSVGDTLRVVRVRRCTPSVPPAAE
jgi:hypothetical protein